MGIDRRNLTVRLRVHEAVQRVAVLDPAPAPAAAAIAGAGVGV